MKRLVIGGLLAAMVVVGLLSAQGMTVIYDDPNEGGTVQPERMLGMAIQPVWLAEPNDPNDPAEPNEPPTGGAE
jgi:hypothetical protein